MKYHKKFIGALRRNITIINICIVLKFTYTTYDMMKESQFLLKKTIHSTLRHISVKVKLARTVVDV